MTGYTICATPRSGSTLLCHLLRASGVAGDPHSYFRLQDRSDWAEFFGLSAPLEREDWPQFLAAAIDAGKGGTTVFGQRLMWDHLIQLTDDLGGNDDLETVFGSQKYIYLQRLDSVAQAISRHKAEVSGTWHLGFEEAEHPKTPQYDFDAILTHLHAAEADHAHWQGWFARKGITPFHLTYEELSADPQGTATKALGFLGLTAKAPLHVTNRKMADAVSAEWAQRFHVDLTKTGC